MRVTDGRKMKQRQRETQRTTASNTSIAGCREMRVDVQSEGWVEKEMDAMWEDKRRGSRQEGEGIDLPSEVSTGAWRV